MDPDEARRRFCTSPIARLASVRPDGGPHLVPVVFAVRDDTIVTAVDGKPKRTRRLQRLVNLASDPHCSLLVDHYEPDWSRLWWVRADGVATIVDPAEAPEELALLTSRYRQYRTAAAQIGPLISVRVTRWTGWVPSGTRQAKSDHVRSDG